MSNCKKFRIKKVLRQKEFRDFDRGIIKTYLVTKYLPQRKFFGIWVRLYWSSWGHKYDICGTIDEAKKDIDNYKNETLNNLTARRLFKTGEKIICYDDPINQKDNT